MGATLAEHRHLQRKTGNGSERETCLSLGWSSRSSSNGGGSVAPGLNISLGTNCKVYLSIYKHRGQR